jgi:uncharacterized protein YcnI
MRGRGHENKGRKMKNVMMIAALLTGFGATSALAHATLEVAEAPAGSYYKAVIRVGHGCDGEATQKLRVEVPDGMIFTKPMPKAGWELDVTEGDYATAIDNHGTAVTKGVKQIVWTGDLPDAYYDEFVFRAKIDETVAVDSKLYIKVVQECANGMAHWDEIPAEGQTSGDLDAPAPFVTVTHGGHSHH